MGRPRRARARKRAMATNSEQAATYHLHVGGAHGDRTRLFASCERQHVFHAVPRWPALLTLQEASVFSTLTSCYSLAQTSRLELAELLDCLVSLRLCLRGCGE